MPRQPKQQPAPKIVQDPGEPVAPEILADAIVRVSDGAQVLLNGPLEERAIFVLIKDACGVPLEMIERVLKTARDLEAIYVKKGARRHGRT